jgi:hypothetical protein
MHGIGTDKMAPSILREIEENAVDDEVGGFGYKNESSSPLIVKNSPEERLVGLGTEGRK